MNSIENDNEVLGTCQIVINVEIREGSPELAGLLAEVTSDGLSYLSRYSQIRGSKLEERIAAAQQRCREALRNSLAGLENSDLALKYAEDDQAIGVLAADLLVSRIGAGGQDAFSDLVAACTNMADRDARRRLEELVDRVVSPAAESIARKGIKELQRLAGAADPVMAYAAKERLSLVAQRDVDLAAIPTLTIASLIAAVKAGKYSYDVKVKAAAKKRIRTETMGSDDVAELLPIWDSQVERFLSACGVQRLGYVDWFPSRCACERWDPAEVRNAIDLTTARLYHRATREFHGKLPDHLHNVMMLTDADDYTKAYLEFLTKKDKANAPASP